ncbi:extracellular solute-binding protein [Tessaracoccus oleiagri]|uniref:Raffinose/stachyose/melibiose transport system substrate-binding protein n=1 Tax=Tessaracoccus oleiagri TaxID=686624 RepID=A0A1G9KHE3_9ACTN|nr:extracellular solute-binding protein [Tessaracoccus oleiagri]SDL49121.1 raffinose/stachyose/melibiose transport system substrate-binding protein [Tessaracoccus oleiagri]
MRRRRLVIPALAATTILALAACAPGSDPDEPAGSETGGGSEPAEVNTDIAGLGDITLTVWDQEVRSSQDPALQALNEAFMEKYPNVTIERVSQSNDDLQSQIALALSGNDVPDVIQVNNARADMGAYVTAGQLVNLEPYAEAYGWADRYSESVLSYSRYSEDGKTFGEGNLYGLPQTGEVVGIFYNKAKLEELGLEVPQTWDDYFAALDAAKAAGEQPMVLGNIDQWPAFHVFGPLQANYVPVDEIAALGLGNEGASWTSDGNVQALEQFGTWGTEGYFGSSPNGTDYDLAWADFAKGTGVFLPAGNWLAGDLESLMGEDVGFMAPPPGTDGTLATTGATGIPFGIPAASENVDAAAAYIDFITTDEAMAMIAENGGMPVNNTADNAPEAGLQKDVFEAFDAVSTEGTLLPYLDWATPSFADTAGQGFQELLGGQKSAADVAQAFEDDYQAFIGG